MIAAFIADKMSSYIAGGMKSETAAGFTRGELEAIYKGNHRGRDDSGSWRVTPPPEVMGIEAAMKKADAALNEILRACADMRGKKSIPSNAPENVPKATPKNNGLEGFEKLAEYARMPA
jgi:hypothetical protein